jgi:ribosomal-protein-alanine N-acetyltransferase
MNLESTRLQLIEIAWDDLDNIHHLHGIAEVDEFNTLGIPETIEETKAVIQPIIDDHVICR